MLENDVSLMQFSNFRSSSYKYRTLSENTVHNPIQCNKMNRILLYVLLFTMTAAGDVSLTIEKKNSNTFVEIAKASSTNSDYTDKITSHTYQTMYGMFLVPLARNAKRIGQKLKFLEIGLGCNMNYGPGKSVYVWRKLFGDTAEIWEGEYDAKCAKKLKESGELKGINLLVGDQGNSTTVNEWVATTGGKFNVIIDDGGHTNKQIKTSFDILFPKALLPGGLYFIEDLQVSRYDLNGVPLMADIIQSYIDQLLIPTSYLTDKRFSEYTLQQRKLYPIPKDIKWILCQHEACVIAKCETASCGPNDFYK